ncbi:hypothetical protein CEXT_89991 [Caerostris extrusa]|uniref:Uncharacterized protein n=1 Tax=Caerostris extrusa TaxID=172846 RepID=A0AAV4WTF0_CAEEX|nr:hypothetical protein CEXT_89991 [Caerostris extrusa]
MLKELLVECFDDFRKNSENLTLAVIRMNNLYKLILLYIPSSSELNFMSAHAANRDEDHSHVVWGGLQLPMHRIEGTEKTRWQHVQVFSKEVTRALFLQMKSKGTRVDTRFGVRNQISTTRKRKLLSCEGTSSSETAFEWPIVFLKINKRAEPQGQLHCGLERTPPLDRGRRGNVRF